MTESPTLQLEGLRHVYDDVVAVDAFDLEVRAGEVVCLLGPSGCGKTTALRVAAGLERLQRGCVRVGGRVVADGTIDTPPENRGIGLVFQDFALFPHLTVLQNVEFGLAGMSAAERHIRAVTVLDPVGMKWATSRYPHSLSGGQQQRVALARALAPEPPVILLDEPFSGLDARLRDQIRDESLHILKNSGIATLLVTHDAEEAMFMADRIAVMRDGRVVQVGKPEELYFRPIDAFVAEFFGEVNRLSGRAAGGRVETPLGMFDAPALGDGLTGRVLAARMLGRSSLIHLCLCEEATQECHLHSRVPGRYLPAEDDRLAIHLDRSQAFVFPAKAGK